MNNKVLMHRCEYCHRNTDVHMGEAQCRSVVFLLFPTADISIPERIMKLLCSDVRIARGILMFIWGKPKTEVLCFLLVPTADISIP